MIRRLFTFLSVVSLLLCAATVVAWRESYSVSRTVIWNGTIDYWIVSNHGLLRFIRTEWVKPGSAGIIRQAYNEEGVFSGETRPYTGMDDCAPTASQLGWQVGLGGDQHPFGDGIERRQFLTIPHGGLACLFLIAPAMALRRWLRRPRRLEVHQCVHCGYDLRATPGRCPECGAAAVPEQKW